MSSSFDYRPLAPGNDHLPDGREPAFMRTRGDCLRAATATVLGIPYEETPDVPEGADASWAAWAAERGLQIRMYLPPARPPIDAGYWIAGVQTGGGEKHAVVMHHDEFVHDPDPEGHLRRRGGDFRIVDGLVFEPLGTPPPATNHAARARRIGAN